MRNLLPRTCCTLVLSTLASLGCSDAGGVAAEEVGTSQAAILTNTSYTFVGVNSGKCMDIANGSTADNANVQQWTCTGSTVQQFKFEDMGGGYYRIRNVNSNKCLDVAGASTTSGANIAQVTCGTGFNQQFQVVNDSGNVHHFIARHSGKAIDVANWSTADGGNVQQWDWLNNDTQKFNVSPVVANPLPANLTWSSSGILVAPKAAKHVALKDPSIAYHNGKYNVYATVYDTQANTWQMVYFNFTSFAQANSAPQYAIAQVPGFSGYNCAPELFYFAPQNKWYLIYQSQPPRYSTLTNVDQPWTLTTPQNMFTTTPAGMPTLPIDYHVICDSVNCHMFFTGDDGKLYRTQTPIGSFPTGWGAVSVVMTYPTNVLFEASSHYKIKDTNTYLTVIEAMGANGRWFSAWTATNLAGPWSEYKVAEGSPFAGFNNVTFPGGRWTNDISHGELVKYQNDQQNILDPNNMQFLYQGRDPASTGAYELLPYRLGLLTATGATGGAPGGVTPVNQLTNPGFESGTTGWAGFGATLSADTVNKRSGTAAGKVTGRTATWQGPLQSVLAKVNKGETYFAKAYARVSSGSQTVNLTVKTDCAGTVTYTGLATGTATSTGWTALNGSFTTATCADLRSVDLYVDGPAAGVDVYVDDAEFY